MMTSDLSRARWRESSFSGNNGNCVETGTAGQAIAVRDSQDPEGPSLVFEPLAWHRIAASLKSGDFPA